MGLLVLQRRVDEEIVLEFSRVTAADLESLTENPIVVQVVDVRGGIKAKIGIEAPKCVSVHRREVFEAIKRSEAPCTTTPTTTAAP